MNEVYIKAEDLNSWIIKHLPSDKDLYSINDLIGAIENLDCELDILQEKYDDLEQDLHDNYRPLPMSEYTGDSYDDRF